MLSSLVLAVALFAGPGGLLSDPEAQRLLGQAQEAFEGSEYARAADLLEQAYIIEPNPQLLYPWAQAERENGNCETAIDLYKRFMESGPPASLVEAAEGNIARCEEALAEADLVIDDDAEPEPEDDLVEPEPEPEPEPAPVVGDDEGTDEPRAWYRDPAGGVLVGLGAAGVVTGGALMGIASSRAKAVGDEETQEDYEAARDGAKSLNTGGVVALSIGSALLVAGVVRWVIVAKKSKRETAGLFVAPSLGGVVLSGRF